MSKRPTSIQLDRLAHTMKRFGYEPKRHELLEIAASAFGYRNSNAFTAAKLTVPMAEPIGTIEVQGSVVVLARDSVSNAIFAVEESFLIQVSAEERCETIVSTPYGHLADVSRLLDDNLPGLDKDQVITTAIEDDAAIYPYVMESIQDDLRLYWSNVYGWASLESATTFPNTTANKPICEHEITWRTIEEACAVNSVTEGRVGVKTFELARKIANNMIGDGKHAGAIFTPQVWIRDDATECDAEGEKDYIITIDLIAFALQNGNETIEDYLEGSDCDEFKTASHAPAWVKNWSGPFDIHIGCPIETKILNLKKAKERFE